MKKKVNKQTSVWVVYFVGFDEEENNKNAGAIDPETIVEPRVGFERFQTTGNADQQRRDAEMTAFLRGGQVLAVVEDEDEKVVQSVAGALEKQILRMR